MSFRPRRVSVVLAAVLVSAAGLARTQTPGLPPRTLAPGKTVGVPTGPRVAPAADGTAHPQQLGLAPAPMRMFLKITNTDGSAAGLSTTNDPLYANWCDLYNFDCGPEVSNSSGKPTLGQFSLTRRLDATSTALFSRLTAGTASNFTFVIVRSTPDRIESWKVTCTGAYVASLRAGGSTDDSIPPLESDSFAFTTMEWSYLDTDATGKAVAEIYASYNASLNKATSGTRPPNYPGGADSNGNGIPDGWETYYGLALGNPNNATDDLDGDGQNNLQEYLAGTVPNNPKSVLRMSAVSRTGSGGNNTVTLTWNSVANKSYIVQSASSPSGPWTAVNQDPIPSAGDDSTTYTFSAATSAPRFFYRVVVSQ